ncbi:MAG: penicillin-binding protein 2 [Leptolyngbyaceae bacterium]|nr:penicillin-binding protein 2 [Leptolyngbyaceae bacterium]
MANGLTFSSQTWANPALLRSQRSLALMMIVTVFMTACTFRLVQLQILQGRENRQRAENNRVRLIPIASDRGNILDHKGKILAANRLSRSIYLWPREQTQEQWQSTAEQLSPILNVPRQEILSKLAKGDYRSAMPVRIRRDITPFMFTALAEKAGQVPGLEIRAESSRMYPHGSLAAHVVGYIGEATAEDMKAHPEYPMGMILGQMGVERMADEQLRGVWGNRLVEIDSRQQELGMLGIRPAVPGTNVALTLDLDLQKAAEKGLNNRRGAVVVLDVKTGAIRALASGPSFDPNLFTRRISQADWDRLQRTDKPFLNRAMEGYPPASTFKVVTAAAGMESGKFSPTSQLGTYSAINIGGISFHEHGGRSYGIIGFREALAVSSNTFFYQMGVAAGPEQIAKWGRRLGIGETSILGFRGGNQGSLPTPDEKEKLYGEPWYTGDTVSMAIGQGLAQVTPLELAVVYAALANGGWRVKPHLLASQTHRTETLRQPTGIKPSTLAAIRSGLLAVVQEGTGRSLNDGSIPLTAGKTGTAEVPGQPDNALYAGFGPVSDPQIAIAIVVENGGYGGVAAVPIAHEIYKAYFKSRKPVPSPVP